MILVTGATGFVGGHVVRALLDAEKPVRCLVRDPLSAAELERLGCELVKGDMTEPATLRRAVDGVESVVHLVAIRQGKRSQFEADHEPRHARSPRRGAARRASGASCT